MLKLDSQMLKISKFKKSNQHNKFRMCRICKVMLLLQTVSYKHQHKNHELPVLYLYMILKKYYQNQEVSQKAFKEKYHIILFG